jgi:hypothetical protein
MYSDGDTDRDAHDGIYGFHRLGHGRRRRQRREEQEWRLGYSDRVDVPVEKAAAIIKTNLIEPSPCQKGVSKGSAVLYLTGTPSSALHFLYPGGSMRPTRVASMETSEVAFAAPPSRR